ncbi:MAG: Hsp70 family protein, partial [Patescibacteria group bacterium]|nr:Hsp70 family protein [Patescibacteria group bacterium]
IEKMKKEAEAHAAEDRKLKEVVDMRNQADTLISVSEKTLKDAGDKAPQADKQAVEDKVKALKEVKDKDDTESIKKAMDALSDAVQKVGAAMYQSNPPAGEAGAGQPGPQAGAGQPGSEQGPVDADYKEVK